MIHQKNIIELQPSRDILRNIKSAGFSASGTGNRIAETLELGGQDIELTGGDTLGLGGQDFDLLGKRADGTVEKYTLPPC